jgi:hypothetical protein
MSLDVDKYRSETDGSRWIRRTNGKQKPQGAAVAFGSAIVMEVEFVMAVAQQNPARVWRAGECKTLGAAGL